MLSVQVGGPSLEFRVGSESQIRVVVLTETLEEEVGVRVLPPVSQSPHRPQEPVVELECSVTFDPSV